MERKILVVIEIVVILLFSIIYIFKEVIPEYKNNIGSSDRFINTSDYKNMFEFNIDNKINFSLVINEEKKIYHIMFFEENAVCLYNQKIENKDLESGLTDMLKILINEGYLNSLSTIKVVRYDNYYYDNFKSILLSLLSRYNLNTNIIESSNSLSDKGIELNIDISTDNEKMLKNIDNYSKEFPRDKKNNVGKKDDDNVSLSETSSKKYSNNVYKKIEKYVKENRVNYLEVGNTSLVISMIPTDDNLKYYPSNNSWYYVKEGRVYAYIEIADKSKVYGYCYNGSIDLIKKGEC